MTKIVESTPPAVEPVADVEPPRQSKVFTGRVRLVKSVYKTSVAQWSAVNRRFDVKRWYSCRPLLGAQH